ncbi:MAG: GAF domain-containing protein [Pseudomarimonas sp.]
MSTSSARLVVHLHGEASQVHLLDGVHALLIGRDRSAGLTIEHASVSRQHAELSRGAAGWTIRDLGSKNGLRVGGERVAEAALPRQTWLAIGDVFCEFEPLSAAALAHIRQRDQARRNGSSAWQERVSVTRGVQALLEDVLTGMLSVAECRRGFLLLGDGHGPLRLAASCLLDVDEGTPTATPWSRSAVERVMRERRPVFMSNHADRVWLKGAASVVGLGLRALACVPLHRGGQLLGVVYVDTDDDAKLFTGLDVELMLAFAERAATALALAALEDDLRNIELNCPTLRLSESETAP